MFEGIKKLSAELNRPTKCCNNCENADSSIEGGNPDGQKVLYCGEEVVYGNNVCALHTYKVRIRGIFK